MCGKIVMAALFIVSIPLWILFEQTTTEAENRAILWMQKQITSTEFFNVFYTMFSNEVTLGIQIFLFLADDSLLAFKGALVYSVGIYIAVMMKLMM